MIAILQYWRIGLVGIVAIACAILWTDLLVTRADLRDAKAELGEVRAEGKAQGERSKRITADLQSKLKDARGQLEKDLSDANHRADDLDDELHKSSARLAACALSLSSAASHAAAGAGGGSGSVSRLFDEAESARRRFIEATARDAARLDFCRAAWPEVAPDP